MNVKTNDWVAVQLNSPKNVTIADIYASGINASNTGIKDAEYYKSIPQVQNTFKKKDGSFDDVAFGQFYESALRSYNEFTDEDFLNNYIKSVERSPYDWTNMDAPVMNTSAYLVPVSDKNRTTMGLGNIWQTGTATFSDREVAQAQFVRDENGKVLDWTPNDWGGLSALTRPTIALATYDEDEYDENGILIHRKGELKLDWKGDPYTEMLGNKSGYGKDIVTISDTLTEEGSFWNEWDPFDSDSIDKSVGATVIETTLKIAPWVIGSFIGATPVLGAIAATKGLAMAMPGFLKAIGGITSNDDTSMFGIPLNKWENYMKRFDSSKSDASRQSGFFNHENIGDIIASSFSQLASQRVVGSLGKYLSSNRDTQSKIGKELAKTYMAITSTTDAYQSFKEAGATDRMAGIGMLATATAMYGLLSWNYFNDWFWKDTWLDEMRDLQNVVNSRIKELQPHIFNVTKEASKVSSNSLKSKLLAKKWFKTVYDWTKDKWSKLPHGTANPSTVGGGIKEFLGTTANRALNEGIEETLEEVSGDMMKALTLGLEWAGFNVSEKGKELNFDFSPESIMSRYFASFVGGSIGGAVFEGYNRIEGNKNPLLYMKDTQQQLQYLYRNGYGEDILKYLDYRREKGELPGNPHLSSINYIFGKELDEKDQSKILYQQGTETDNQQKNLYDFVRADIQHMFDVLDSELVHSKDFEVLKTQILAKHLAERERKGEDVNIEDYFDAEYEALLETGVLNQVVWDLDNARNKVFETKVKLEKANKRLTEAKESSEKNTAKKDVDGLNEQLKFYLNEHEEIRTGQRADYYMNGAMLALNRHLLSFYFNDLPVDKPIDFSKPTFLDNSVQRYADFMYNIKNFNELSKAQQDLLIEEFNIWSRESSKDARLKLLSDVHYRLSGKFGKQIEQVAKDYTGFSHDWVLEEFGEKNYKFIQNIFSKINETISKEAELLKVEDQNNEEWSGKIQEIQAEKIAWVRVLQSLKTERQTKADELLSKKEKGEELTHEEQLFVDQTKEFNELFDILTTSEFESIYERETYKETVKNFYSKYNLDKRVSNHRDLPLKHYIDTQVNEIKSFISELDEIGKDLGTNLWRVYISTQFSTIRGQLEQIAMNLYSNNKLSNPTVFNDQIAMFVNTFAKDFVELLDNFVKNPFNVKRLLDSFTKRVETLVIAPEEITADSNVNNRLITERWQQLGTTPEEFLKQLLSPNISGLEEYGDLINVILNDIVSLSEELSEYNVNASSNEFLKQLLQDVSVEVNGKPLNIFARFQAEMDRLKLKINDLDEFELDSQSVDELTTALGMIQIMASLIQSSGNHNTVVNQYKDALGKKDRFAELDDNSRELLLSQLSQLAQQIQDILDIDKNNAISLLEEQKQITFNMQPKFIKALYDYEDKDKKILASSIKSLFGRDIVKEWWDKRLKDDNLDLDNLDDESYPKFVEARRAFYNMMRTEYAELVKKEGSHKAVGAKFAKMLDASLKNLKSTKFKRKDSKTTNDDAVTIIDAATYFLSVIGTDLNDFELRAKAINEKSTEFLPFTSQEYAAQLTWASIMNKDLFNSFLDGVERGANKGDEEYVKGMRKLHNFMMIDGVAGSGKSSGVARLLAAVLKSQGYEIIGLSKIEKRAAKLNKTIEGNNHGTVLDALDKIFVDPSNLSKNVDYAKIRPEFDKSTNHYKDLPNDQKDLMQAKPVLTTKVDSKKIVYFIDEITLQTEDELLVFNEYVKKLNENGHDVSFVGLGDSTQSHAYDGNAGRTTNIADYTYLRTPQLAVSLRKANRGKRDNLELVESWIKDGVDLLRDYPGSMSSEITTEVEKKRPNKALIYQETKDAFYGEHFITDGAHWVEKLLNKKPIDSERSKILIITDDKSKSKYNTWTSDEYKDRIDFSSIENAQGDEYDYVIVDVTFNGTEKDYFEQLRQFYTSISRSRMGTVIVSNGNDGDPAKLFKLQDEQTDDATVMLFNPNPEKKKKQNDDYRTWRLKMYGNLETSESSEKDDKNSKTEDSKLDTPPVPQPGPSLPSPNPEKAIDNLFTVPEKKKDFNLDEIRKEAREGTGRWSKLLQQSDEHKNAVNKSDSQTLLDDIDYYAYLENLSNDFLKISGFEESPEISKEKYIEICKIVSNLVLNGKKPDPGILTRIERLGGITLRNLIQDAFSDQNVKSFYQAVNETDKDGKIINRILYYIISKPNANSNTTQIAFPISILGDNVIDEGSYSKLEFAKNNGIIPITSKGNHFISLSEFYKRTGLTRPKKFGMYVGSTEKESGQQFFTHLSYGKAFLPLLEPSSQYLSDSGIESFYKPFRDKNSADFLWMTQGYADNDVNRVEECVMQRRISVDKYFQLAKDIHKHFFETPDSMEGNEIRLRIADFFDMSPDVIKGHFSQTTDKNYRLIGNKNTFELFNQLQILSPYGSRGLFTTLYRFAIENGGEVESNFSQALFNLIASEQTGLHLSFKTDEEFESLDLYLVRDKGEFKVFAKHPSNFEFEYLPITIPFDADKNFGRIELNKLAQNVRTELSKIIDPDKSKDRVDSKLLISLKGRISKVVEMYSTEQDIDSWYNSGYLTIGINSTYIPENESGRKFAQMLDAQLYEKLYKPSLKLDSKDSSYGNKFAEFVEQDGIFKNQLYTRLYKRGDTGEDNWKTKDLPDKEYYQWDIVDAILPSYTLDRNGIENASLSDEESTFAKSLSNRVNTELEEGVVSLSINDPSKANLSIENISNGKRVQFGTEVYATPEFISEYFGEEFVSTVKDNGSIVFDTIWWKNSGEVEVTFSNGVILNSNNLTVQDVENLLGVTFIDDSQSYGKSIVGFDLNGEEVEITYDDRTKKYSLKNEDLVLIGITDGNEIVLQSKQLKTIYKIPKNKDLLEAKKYIGNYGVTPVIEIDGVPHLLEEDGFLRQLTMIDGVVVDNDGLLYDINWDFSYNPTNIDRFEINNNSKWQESGNKAILSEVKVNGSWLSKFVQGIYPGDTMYSIDSIDFDQRIIVINNTDYALKPAATKDVLLNELGLIPTPRSTKGEGEYNIFKNLISKKIKDLPAELFVDDDIEASLNNINDYVEQNRFVTGKYYVYSWRNGKLTHKDKDALELLKDVKLASKSLGLNLIEISSAVYEDGSKYGLSNRKFFVTLSNGEIHVITATKRGSKTTYENITEEPITNKTLIQRIEISSLSEESKNALKTLLETGEVPTITDLNPEYAILLAEAIVESFNSSEKKESCIV